MMKLAKMGVKVGSKINIVTVSSEIAGNKDIIYSNVSLSIFSTKR